MPDERTVFRIASMSKSFTASAILLLRDAAALSLDDPAAAYVPELAGWVNGAADAGPLTIRHLLTMTAGFPTDDPWGDRQQGLPLDEFDALLARGVSFNWAPGTRFEYSNLGYAILGRVVAAASGVPYDEFIRTRLLAPLRMSRTGFAAEEFSAAELATGYRRGPGGWLELPFDPYGAFAPMGGVFSCVADLATWSAGFAAAFPPDGTARTGGTGSGAPHPLSARVPAADAAAAGGDRVARARPDPRRAARGAVVLRLRAVRRRGPRVRPGGEPQRRLPGLRIQHALASGDRACRHRARQRHLLAHALPGRVGAQGAAYPLGGVPRRPGACPGRLGRPGRLGYARRRRVLAGRGRRPWRPPTR